MSVDDIITGLRESAARTQEITMGPPIVTLQSAEAAVHAAVRETDEAWRKSDLVRQAMDDARAETVREIEAMLREYPTTALSRWEAAELVARRFGPPTT